MWVLLPFDGEIKMYILHQSLRTQATEENATLTKDQFGQYHYFAYLF